jgi:spore coat protein A, manganese oxidase
LRRTPDDGFNHFYTLNRQGTALTYFQWGLKTDRVLLQDYDGDGKTDFAVWRFDTWYILNSSNGSFRAEQFGNSNLGDVPIYGDYDGDGRADLAVRRAQGNFMSPMPVTFIIKFSASGNWQVFTMGDRRGDVVVPGDYDGDGKTDMALWGGDNFEFGDGRWKWIRSSDGHYQSVRYGLPGDNPVPGDYDGDGKTDLAVYRRGGTQQPQQYFYIQQSRDGFKAVPWGSSDYQDDTPMGFMNTR